MSKMNRKTAGNEPEAKVPADLRKALAAAPESEGKMGRSHADRAPRFYQLDTVSQTTGDT